MSKIEWLNTRKGNSRIKSDKYILVYCPKHPNAKGKGHILEHRYIMECYLKRYLESSEHIHHINKIGNDNRIENLQLVTPTEHAKIHYSTENNKKGIEALNKYSQKIKLPRIEIKCECGCNQTLINRDNKARLRKFIKGHNAKGCRWKWKKNL